MKNDDQLKQENPELYHIAREKGTEMPFTGKYVHTKEKGMYKCAVCGQQLFSSDTKFDSGSGWPSFYDSIPGSIKTKEDNSGGMNRVEVTCSRCGAHLGHLFDDAPQTPTGARLCINSCSLDLEKDK
jgi:peptide-methionine (R)-S-oxide reductase